MCRFLLLFSILMLPLLSAPVMAEQTVSKEISVPARKPAVQNAAANPAQSEETKPVPEAPAARSAAGMSEGEALISSDMDEAYDLPEYPLGARIAMGKPQTYIVEEEDTFLDIARHFKLGYVELRAVNPDVDPWAPVPGEVLAIPTFRLLPRARQEGIVVNLGNMRMFYFQNPGQEPLTFPLGIGREGLQTPTGDTTIVRKAAGPSWHPTPRMREEKPWLPETVPAGPANPLGTHALYLGWPTFLIHGSNKPWGIGRRVSSGCMRMYPEDIVDLFGRVPVGTRVTVVDQPILVGWLDDGLYLEANPSKKQSYEIEIDAPLTPKPLTEDLRNMIIKAAGVAADRIDWSAVEKAVLERQGVPVRIAVPGSSARKTIKTGGGMGIKRQYN